MQEIANCYKSKCRCYKCMNAVLKKFFLICEMNLYSNQILRQIFKASEEYIEG